MNEWAAGADDEPDAEASDYNHEVWDTCQPKDGIEAPHKQCAEGEDRKHRADSFAVPVPITVRSSFFDLRIILNIIRIKIIKITNPPIQ